MKYLKYFRINQPYSTGPLLISKLQSWSENKTETQYASPDVKLRHVINFVDTRTKQLI